MADRIQSFMALGGDDVNVRWLVTLLHFLWQGAVVGAAVAIAGRLLRGASAQVRYALCSAALLSLPVCAAVTFCVVDVPVGLQPSPPPESSAAVPAKLSTLASQRAAAPAATPVATAEAPRAPAFGDRVARSAAATEVVAEDSSPSAPFLSAGMLAHAAPWIMAAYAVGVLCFLFRLTTALWGGHRLGTRLARVTDARLLGLIADQATRLKLKCVPAVAYCERVAAPTVLGLLRPMILLPAAIATGLPPDDFAAILRHELAHIRRYDLWMNLVQRVVESLLFFHPVVWLISRRLSTEREVCCDDLVVSSGYEPMRYAGALLRMAELCAVLRRPAAVALAAGGDKKRLLERRIERLMNWDYAPRLQMTRAGMAGLLVALALLIVAPGIARTWAQPPAKADFPAEPPKNNAALPRIHANSPHVAVRTLGEPALLLPDRWHVAAVGFDRQGKELVTASVYPYAMIHRWDIAGGQLASEVKLTCGKHGTSFHGLILSADCRRAIAATDGYVGIWDTSTGRLIKTLPIPKIEVNDRVRLLTCTPDLSVIAASLGTEYSRTTLAYAAHAVVWDVASGKIVRTITHEHAMDFRAMALSPDGKQLATTNGGGPVIWDVSTGEQTLTLPNDNSDWKRSHPKTYNRLFDTVMSLQFSPDGRRLAFGDLIGVKLANAQSGKLVHWLEATGYYGGYRLVFSQDGQRLAQLGVGKTVPIWSTQTGDRLFELHTESEAGAFSGDDQQFAVGFSDHWRSSAVWQFSGAAEKTKRGYIRVAETDKLAVGSLDPLLGKKAAAFADKLKPTWSDAQSGIQCGVAINQPRRQFHAGQRIPMTLFFRNTSDRPLYVEFHPDPFGNLPKVVDRRGTAVAIETVAVLGPGNGYRNELKPGETFGPFHFSVCLGDNPRPGKQDWYPCWKTTATGSYKLTYAISFCVADRTKVADPSHGNAAQSKGWENANAASGPIEFDVVEGKP
jgi:beta-lactamase regulating signal transducer with metallopeptidase domain/WD40 repeat protein